MWKMYFSHEAICILFWNALNSSNFILGSFLVLKLVTCLFFRNVQFFCCKKIWNAPFFLSHFGNGKKLGISKFFRIEKWGISKKRHVTSFKTRNEPKMKLFEFGAFQNKMHMASREKYIFHMLLGAFHDTPRTQICLNPRPIFKL